MRAPIFLVGLVQWRWTPSVVLVAGSLAFVGIVVLIVPDDFGGVTSGADSMSRAARRNVAKKIEGPVGESPPSIADDREPAAISPQRAAEFPPAPVPPAHNIVQSIFHQTPKVELPVEPVDPNPPPPPEPPPLPAPTQTVFTLENPSPPPLNPNAIPEAAPEEPQGTTAQ
jgi:hypothetical protein